MITQAVRAAMGPLEETVARLREQLHRQRRVITHKEAPAYFNYDVQPETILRYIKEEGLPAVQRGRLYFIEVEALYAWQLRRETGQIPTGQIPAEGS